MTTVLLFNILTGIFLGFGFGIGSFLALMTMIKILDGLVNFHNKKFFKDEEGYEEKD